MGEERVGALKRLMQAITVLMENCVLTRTWCSKCHESPLMVPLSGRVVSGILVITGKCGKCGSKVERASFRSFPDCFC